MYILYIYIYIQYIYTVCIYIYTVYIYTVYIYMHYLFIANCINRTTVSPSRCLGIVFIHDVLPRSLNRQRGIALVMKPFQKGDVSQQRYLVGGFNLPL